MVTLRPLFALLLLFTLLTGCEKSAGPDTTSTADTPASALAPDEGLDLSTRYSWTLVTALPQQITPPFQALQTAITALVKSPTDDSLQQAREQWQLAHNQLQQLALLFSLGEASPSLFAQLRQAHFQLDAWPIEPGYLDYFDVYPHSGLVNDIVITIDEPSIRDQHGFTSPYDISLGMHAIAYLLWGEDHQRPATDFVQTSPTALQQKSGVKPEDLPNQRRAALLSLQAQLLTDDLKALGYKLSQPASGLNSIYTKLPPQTQLQLWRQSVEHLLTHLQQQLPAQQQPTAENDIPEEGEEHSPHNAFAGGQGKLLAATVAGLSPVLLNHEHSAQPLAYWLNRNGDLDALKTLLQQTETALSDADKDWNTLAAENIQALNAQVLELKAWFSIGDDA